MNKTRIKSMESEISRLRRAEREIIKQIITYRKAELKSRFNKIKIEKL